MSLISAAAVSPSRSRLDSWKMIGAFFNCNERTVKRWEKERGLPIRRLPGAARSRIFAEVTELEAWLRTGGVAAPAVISAAQPQPVAEGNVYRLNLTSFTFRPYDRAFEYAGVRP